MAETTGTHRSPGVPKVFSTHLSMWKCSCVLLWVAHLLCTQNQERCVACLPDATTGAQPLHCGLSIHAVVCECGRAQPQGPKHVTAQPSPAQPQPAPEEALTLPQRF
jgi:hypothetical protein